MKSVFTLAIVLGCLNVSGQSIDTAQAIKDIRKEYSLINSSRDHLLQKTWDVVFKTGFEGLDEDGDSIWVEDGSPYETIATYSDSKGIRLIEVDGGQYEGYSTFYHQEFYFKDGKLFFFFSRTGCTGCPDADNPDDVSDDISMVRVTETRSYFHQQKNIRELTKSYKAPDQTKMEEISERTPSSDVTRKPGIQTYSFLKKLSEEYVNKKEQW